MNILKQNNNMKISMLCLCKDKPVFSKQPPMSNSQTHSKAEDSETGRDQLAVSHMLVGAAAAIENC